MCQVGEAGRGPRLGKTGTPWGTEIHHGGASPTDYLYTFDAAGRLTVKSENSVLTTYTYDLTNQLTADGINDIAYDANGNRESNGNATYTTGPGNQLLSDGTWDYTYDLEGNVTEKERIGTDEKWTYIYNHRNQLIRAEHTTDGSTVDREAEYK